MLVLWGKFDGANVQQTAADWHVDEGTGCGYMRVYDVYAGTVTCTEKDRRFRLPKGKICLLPTSEPYSLRQDLEDCFHCRYYHITVTPALLPSTVILDAPKGSFIRSFFDAAAAAMDEKNDSVLMELFEAFRIYCHTQNLFYEPGGEIGKVLSAMSLSIEKEWTVQELSSIAGYSEAHFIRLFHAETGMSPYQYLTEERMNTALELLQTDIPVSQTAKRVGYSELKTFSRAFRQRYGVSPSQYRSRIRFYP